MFSLFCVQFSVDIRIEKKNSLIDFFFPGENNYFSQIKTKLSFPFFVADGIIDGVQYVYI